MKHNFKVGDEVRLIPGLTKEDADEIQLRSYGWVSPEMDRARDSGEIGVIKVFYDDGGIGVRFPSMGNYTYSPNWLVPVGEEEGQTIPVSELERIYDIACSSWKARIRDMVVPFQKTVHIPSRVIDQMFKSATEVQLPVVKDVFKDYKRGNFFDFGSSYQIDTSPSRGPFVIRRGMASSNEMTEKEIGFVGRAKYEHVLVHPDGKEEVLEPGTKGHYIKVRLK